MSTEVTKKKNRKFQPHFYCFILVLMFLVTCIAAFSRQLEQPGMDAADPVPFDHWMTYQDEEQKYLTIPVERYGNKVVEADAKEAVSVTGIVPDINSDNHILFFHSNNQRIKVYVNEVEIYSFGETDPNFPIKIKTPGNIWNKVDLTEEMSGQRIRVESISPYKTFSGVFQPAYFALASDTARIVLKNSGAGLVVGLILLVAGTVFIFFSIAYHNSFRFAWLKYIGQFYMFISFWILGESGGLEFIIDNPVFIYFVTLLSLMMAPLAFMMYMKEVYLPGSKALDVHIYAYDIYVIASVSLQLLIPVDLLEMLPLTFILIIILSLSGIVILIKEGQRKTKRFGFVYFITIFITGACIDIFRFFVHGVSCFGMATGIAVCLFMLFHLNYLIKLTIMTEHTVAQLETELSRSNMELLLSQIKPHFLYNSLNSISYLCKTNPVSADQAVIHFANFLRANMNSIEKRGLIRFEKEIEHIKNYVFLEKIRFPCIDVIYSLHYTNFEIPPLTLQPVVENAIKHGVSKKIDGGCVTIETLRVSDVIMIKVSDTGVGFDPKQINIMKSTGLRNIEKRLQTLCRAEINIESQSGKGTVVTIQIPVEKEEPYEGNLCR